MTYSIGGHVLAREVGDELVLLDTSGEEYLALNNVGTAIWHALIALGSTDAVVTQLLPLYEIDEKTLCADVERLLAELLGQGLIVAT